MRRNPKPGPRTLALARRRFDHAVQALQDDEMRVERMRELAPDAWAMLEADVPCAEKKAKVTLYLDEPTAKFFRAMGPGYQERINRLLTLYAQARIAEFRWFDEAWEREYGRMPEPGAWPRE